MIDVVRFNRQRAFIPAVMSALFFATLLWFIYMALEPYVRRWWPHRIVAWSRLLAGDFRDPLVGRDILIGAVFGVAIQVVIYLAYLAPGGWGISPTGDPTLSTLLGLRESVGWFFDPRTIFLGLSYLFLLLLLYLLCRRKEWLSSLAAWLLPTVVFGLGARNHVIGTPGRRTNLRLDSCSDNAVRVAGHGCLSVFQLSLYFLPHDDGLFVVVCRLNNLWLVCRPCCGRLQFLYISRRPAGFQRRAAARMRSYSPCSDPNLSAPKRLLDN